MEYNFREIEKKWHDYWIAEKVYKVEVVNKENSEDKNGDEN